MGKTYKRVTWIATAHLCSLELRRMDGRNQRKGGVHLWQS